MPSTAISAQGSTLAIGATTIENLYSFSGFDGEANEIDITNLESLAKEYLIGLTDFGSFSGEYHPDWTGTATGQDALRAAEGSPTPSAFTLTTLGGANATFNALVKNASSASGGVDAAMTGSFSLKITGDVTIAAS